MAIDYNRGVEAHLRLQQSVDSAALAAAQLGDATDSEHHAAADLYLDSNFNEGTDFSGLTMTAVNNGDDTVTVSVHGNLDAVFMQVGGYPQLYVAASATAEYTEGTGNGPCILALHPSSSDALYLDSNAQIEASGCDIQSNSSSSSGITAYSNSHVTADSICVVGGASGGSSHYTPSAQTGCDPVNDPLSAIAPPSVGSCDHSDAEYDSVTTTLNPGVYCGGLTIKGNANITFNSGIYIIKNGKFFVDSNSQVTGAGVGFYLTGSDAVLHFTSNVVVDFTAPTSGSMAGIIFFEDRSAPTGRVHYFDSNNISRLEGTIYLSRGTFSSDSNTQISASSAFTNVVARKVWLNSNARLTLNSDYGSSSVPNLMATPTGVTSVMLVQ
jgi:hypothetical protein